LVDKSLLVVLTSPPYTIQAVDGMLTVLGVRPKLGWEVSIFLVGEGVFLAKKGQDAMVGVYARVAGAHEVPFHEVNFEKALNRLIQEGVNVYISRDSCDELGLDPSEVMGKVKISDYRGLAMEIMHATASFFF
jgi:predicted peroxiredoxin